MADRPPLEKRVRDKVKASEEADRRQALKTAREREAAQRSRDLELQRLRSSPDHATRVRAAEQAREEAAARWAEQERPLRQLEEAIAEFCRYSRWRLSREFKIDGPVRRVRQSGWIILPVFETREEGPYSPDPFDGGSGTDLPAYTQIVVIGLTTSGEVVKLTSGRTPLVPWSATRIGLSSCLQRLPNLDDQLVEAIARIRRFGSHPLVRARSI